MGKILKKTFFKWNTFLYLLVRDKLLKIKVFFRFFPQNATDLTRSQEIAEAGWSIFISYYSGLLGEKERMRFGAHQALHRLKESSLRHKIAKDKKCSFSSQSRKLYTALKVLVID